MEHTMANVKEDKIWEEGIYQLEVTDPVVGGIDGISNKQAKQLANRTGYLREQIENDKNSVDTALAKKRDVEDSYSKIEVDKKFTAIGTTISNKLDKTETAADSAKLGGIAADKFAKKDDIPQAATETKAGIVKLKNSITGSLSDTAISEKAIADFIASNFANSKQEFGYTKLPNGLIFQWGKIGERTNDSIKVTYPITFPNICLSLIVGNLIDAHPNTTGGGGHQRINSFDNNKTGFTAKGPYGYTSHYLAIGY